jgi:hypothetical protein
MYARGKRFLDKKAHDPVETTITVVSLKMTETKT